jgi:hypothetical protein
VEAAPSGSKASRSYRRIVCCAILDTLIICLMVLRGFDLAQDMQESQRVKFLELLRPKDSESLSLKAFFHALQPNCTGAFRSVSDC